MQKIKRFRTPESVKKHIDYMLKHSEVILDHGIGSYRFDGTFHSPIWVGTGMRTSPYSLHKKYCPEVDRGSFHEY